MSLTNVPFGRLFLVRRYGRGCMVNLVLRCSIARSTIASLGVDEASTRAVAVGFVGLCPSRTPRMGRQCRAVSTRLGPMRAPEQTSPLSLLSATTASCAGRAGGRAGGERGVGELSSVRDWGPGSQGCIAACLSGGVSGGDPTGAGAGAAADGRSSGPTTKGAFPCCSVNAVRTDPTRGGWSMRAGAAEGNGVDVVDAPRGGSVARVDAGTRRRVASTAEGYNSHRRSR